MADKLRTQQQLEALQNKYIGTGHADTTKHEWVSNMMRDSYASFQGHPAMNYYMAVASSGKVKKNKNGESIVPPRTMESVRMECMKKLERPAGRPPAVEEG